MRLNELYYLRSFGDRAVHHQPGNGHLRPSLQAPRSDFRHLLVFSTADAAQRYAWRINLGPSFYKVHVSPITVLLKRRPIDTMVQPCRPSVYVEV